MFCSTVAVTVPTGALFCSFLSVILPGCCVCVELCLGSQESPRRALLSRVVVRVSGSCVELVWCLGGEISERGVERGSQGGRELVKEEGKELGKRGTEKKRMKGRGLSLYFLSPADDLGMFSVCVLFSCKHSFLSEGIFTWQKSLSLTKLKTHSWNSYCCWKWCCCRKILGMTKSVKPQLMLPLSLAL